MDPSHIRQDHSSHENHYNEFDLIFDQFDKYPQLACYIDSVQEASVPQTLPGMNDNENVRIHEGQVVTHVPAHFTFANGLSSMAGRNLDAHRRLIEAQPYVGDTGLPPKDIGSSTTEASATEPPTPSSSDLVEDVYMTGAKPVLSFSAHNLSYDGLCTRACSSPNLLVSTEKEQEKALYQPPTWSSGDLVGDCVDLEKLSLDVAPTTVRAGSSSGSRTSSSDDNNALDMAESLVPLSVPLASNEDKIEWWSSLLPLDSSEYNDISVQHSDYPTTWKNPETLGAAIERDPVGAIYEVPNTQPHIEESPLSMPDGIGGIPLDYSDDRFGRQSFSSYQLDANSENDQSARSHISSASARSSQSVYSRDLLGPRQGRRRMHQTSVRSRAASLSSAISSAGSHQPSATKLLFECSACGPMFTRKASLTRHYNAIHTFQQVWICQAVVHNNIPAEDQQALFASDSEAQHGCPICLPNMSCAHNMKKCMTKPERERTYYRLDGFKQHLHIVHGFDPPQLKTMQCTQWYRTATPTTPHQDMHDISDHPHQEAEPPEVRAHARPESVSPPQFILNSRPSRLSCQTVAEILRAVQTASEALEVSQVKELVGPRSLNAFRALRAQLLGVVEVQSRQEMQQTQQAVDSVRTRLREVIEAREKFEAQEAQFLEALVVLEARLLGILEAPEMLGAQEALEARVQKARQDLEARELEAQAVRESEFEFDFFRGMPNPRQADKALEARIAQRREARRREARKVLEARRQAARQKLIALEARRREMLQPPEARLTEAREALRAWEAR